MTSPEAPRADKERDAAAGRRAFPRVTSLSSLIGAHPDALRALFGIGRPTDPAELGDAPRGRILALSGADEAFLVKRAFLRLLGRGLLPWEGKSFDHGGNSGRNVIFGKQVTRFRAETSASFLDGKPALLLSYEDAAYRNAWPARAMSDELRTIGDGIAIGPALFRARDGERKVVLWFGLEAR